LSALLIHRLEMIARHEHDRCASLAMGKPWENGAACRLGNRQSMRLFPL
jgi:hypothetical protein